MKPTQLAELFANIKAGFVSFFSIMMFVALGIGIFTGIYWMRFALAGAADAAFESGALHDIQVQFPYGLTEQDMAQLAAVEGVERIEGARQSFQQFVRGDRKVVAKVQSVTQDTNTLQLVEGTLPETADELVMHEQSARSLGFSVGDTVVFTPDADMLDAVAMQEGSGDSDAKQRSMKYLYNQEFTVVGIANSPEYLALSSQSYGIAPMGAGAIGAIAWVDESAFDASAFQDAWPVVNVHCSDVEGLGTFSEEYRSKVSAVEERVSALGATLADERFRSLHDAGQTQIDEGEGKLDEARAQLEQGEAQLEQGKEELAEGEQQITEGQAQLEEGQRQIAEGQAQLEEGRAEYAEKTESAKAQLDAALAQLEEAHAQYDEAEAKLQRANELNAMLQERYPEAKRLTDTALQLLDGLADQTSSLYARYQSGEMSADEYQAAALEAYETYRAAYDAANTGIVEFNEAVSSVQAEFPDIQISGSIPELPALPSLQTSPGDAGAEDLMRQIDSALSVARSGIDASKAATITVEGASISFDTADVDVPAIDQKVAQANALLAENKAELDAGEEKYEQGVATYNEEVARGREKLADAEAQLEAAKEKAAQGRQDLDTAREQAAEGKAQLEEKGAQLEEGKAQLASKESELDAAKRQLDLLKNYDWTVMTREYNGGAIEVDVFGGVTSRLSYSMAALFVIVGLLVSYSAVSRIVHEQVTQIGTKKALGLRSREITVSYLLYATLAVVFGAILGLVIGVVAVEGIIGRALAARFALDTVPPYFDVPLSLVALGAELLLVLGATWFACYGILREHAVELLRGEKPPEGKERFFEKWKVWDRLPLYTQTIVNNCINDKRRVFSTIVGVAGCTALVVTAVTLNNNVLASYDKHYQDVYNFDTIVFMETDQGTADGESPASKAAQKLEDQGFASAVVLRQRNAVKLPTGKMESITMVVPEDEERFAQVYHVRPLTDGPVDLDQELVWVAHAYADHLGAQVGDEVEVSGSDGAVHALTIGGFYDFYLTNYEMVIGRSTYEKLFLTSFAPNAVFTNRGSATAKDVENIASSVDGFDCVSDDKDAQNGNFAAFSNVSRTVVLVYLALSVLMAIVVLLNLNVMFIEEKKRELIVLMINGFSVKDAKRYVYQDTILLTVIGIAAGLALGAFMGSVTVGSVEPPTASFYKGLDATALIAGAAVSAILAAIMSFIALRRVPAFSLTDINRF